MQASIRGFFTHLKWTFVCRGGASPLLDAPAQIRVFAKLKLQNAARPDLRAGFLYFRLLLYRPGIVRHRANCMAPSAFQRPFIDPALYYQCLRTLEPCISGWSATSRAGAAPT
jgi:hypothetical protein